MRCSLLSLRFLIVVVGSISCLSGLARAQIAAPLTVEDRHYRANGMTDQPFTVEVVGSRRTVGNVLLIKLAITNNGNAPLQPGPDFAGDTNPTDKNRISAFYVLDPNGRKKYLVLRDAQNHPYCSAVEPPIPPKERRNVFAQFEAPPDTSSNVDLYFPKADPILGVPMGLPQAGEPNIPGADVVAPAGMRTPANVPLQPSMNITVGANNNEPNLYTNQTEPIPPNSPMKAIGTVDSANSTVPFTVDVLSLSAPNGKPATLKLALTNNGSGYLEAAGQFAAGIGDLADTQSIAGVFAVDPVSKQRFEVVRSAQGEVAASKINPALAPGERRVVEAQLSTIPTTVKSVYLYFPHAAPISGVPVSR